MADLKKCGEVPLSPKECHQRDIGTGTYNCFNLLQPRAAVHKLALAVDMLFSNQEKLLSAVVNATGAGCKNVRPTFADVMSRDGAGPSRTSPLERAATKKPAPPTEVSQEKKTLPGYSEGGEIHRDLQRQSDRQSAEGWAGC